MGGHGGLNILPQKRWNVYNYDNREKVRQDEEAAAKEEQLKREQARKRDAEFRLEKLRQARGLASSSSSSTPPSTATATAAAACATEIAEPELQLESKSKSNHINLFEGIKIFDPIRNGGGAEGDEENKGANKRMKMMKMMKKEAPPPRVVTAEDEKYRLGYGIAGKGVKLPWYMSRPVGDSSDHNDENGDDYRGKIKKEGVKSNDKKSLQELREERLKREKREKERERALLFGKGREKGSGRWERDLTVPKDRYFSRR